MDAPSSKQSKLIYDPLYGFIELTSVEWDIIHTPFYQRLRWIKQIGFSCYTFHGAEHSRYGHSIGVMFNAHKILESIGKAVRAIELFDNSFESKDIKCKDFIISGGIKSSVDGFRFSELLRFNNLIGLGSVLLKHAKDLNELDEFIHQEIENLKLANCFFEVNK